MDAVARTNALRDHALARDADAMLAAVLAAVDPAAWIREHAYDVVGETQRVRVVAIGKAADVSARALVDALGDRIAEGLAIDPRPSSPAIGPIEVIAGAHPLPDAASVRAGARALELVARGTADDVVLFAISGGASALACVPVDGLGLDDLRTTTDALARAGVDIATTNAVRGRLDRLKHGGLARACVGRAVALVLVDVPSGDPRLVGSGPTLAPDAAATDAAVDAVLARVGDALPRSVHDVLARHEHAPATPEVELHVVGDNASAVAAARAEARARGYALVDGEPLVGEARELGERLGRRARELVDGRPSACIVGGEPTVARASSGRGGRMLELALGAASSIAGMSDVALVAFATDGLDGSSGGAGAVVDGSTLARAAALGLDPAHALATHDTAPFFAALGDLLHVGATGTNVCDLVLLLARERMVRPA